MSNTSVRIGARLTGIPRDAGWRLGLNRSFFEKARGARILLYHGICAKDHLRYNTLFIQARTFESQLRFYRKYFNLVSLDDFYQQRFSSDRYNLCLSFDDGFSNNHKYILPLLESYEVPAAFFVTAIRNAGYDILWNDMLSIANRNGPAKIVLRDQEFLKGKGDRYISSSTGTPLVNHLRSAGFEDKVEMLGQLNSLKNKAEEDYWLQMTADQVKEMSRSKWVTIGSHSYYHNDLALVPFASAKDDLIKSKDVLENMIDKQVSALAFPYGSYSREVVNEAKGIGYTQLLATEFIFEEDRADESLRERLTINPFISNINQMHANVTGHY